MTATKRLFIGLMADASLRVQLEAYQSLWTWPEGARLVPPSNFHLTLRFLGATDAAVQAKLLEWLRLVPIEPFDLQFGSPGAFEGGIVWVSPAPTPRLEALHERVNAAAAWAGFPALDAQWTPHLTLARHGATAKPPSSSLRLHWRVERFSLVSSEGGRYQTIATWPAGTAPSAQT